MLYWLLFIISGIGLAVFLHKKTKGEGVYLSKKWIEEHRYQYSEKKEK